MGILVRAVVIALAVAAAVAPFDSRIVERWYSTGVYPIVQRVVTPVSNLVPFAWLDILAVLALCAVAVTLVRGVLQARRKRSPRPLLHAAGTLLTGGALIYLLFLAIWGLNYRRVSMTDRLVFERDSASSQAVLDLGRTSVRQLNAMHAAAHTQGWRTSPWRDHGLSQSFASVQRLLSDAAPAVPGRLKWTMFGPYFRWTNVDGMINPFGLEALGNPDLLPFERPFVAAHEWAHLAGFADESEASFVGWLTCVRASTPSAYSGWLFLYWQIFGESGQAERQHLASLLAEGPRRDVAAIAERLRTGQVPLLRDAGWRVYDEYLKANRIEEGVHNYGAVVSLLARARFEDGWTPVRQHP